MVQRCLRRRGAGLILAASFRCGRMFLRCLLASMLCLWCCITLRGTGGRCGSWYGTLRDFMRRGCRGGRPGLCRLRFSMRTTRCGSARCWGTRAMARACLGRQLGYWRDRLAGLPEQIDLPLDRPRPAVSSYRGDQVGLRLSAELHGGLVGLGRASGASLFMVVQAGLAALLTRLGAGFDIAIGSPIAGRTDAGLMILPGFLSTRWFCAPTRLATRASARWWVGFGRAIWRRTGIRTFRLSGLLRFSTLCGRCRAIRCSR